MRRSQIFNTMLRLNTLFRLNILSQFNILSQSNSPFRFCSRLRQTGQRLLILAIGLPLLLLSSGCNTTLNNLNSAFLSAPLELTILQVEPSGQPGTYTVSGNATLPDDTPITVSAVRYLQANTRLSSSAEASPPYVILDRQFAQVKQDNWQTQLTLWQVAPDGTFQEAWQLNQKDTGITYEPDSTVTFLATLDPPHQPSDLQERVEQLDDELQAALMRFTTDGELYVQADKSLPIALPTGSTTPPAAGTAPATRTALSPTSVTPTAATSSEDWQQTTAPLPPDAVLR